jgi:aryl carrier-like protein
LALYSDYIERFYGSRNDEAARFPVDADSIESIQDAIRKILASSLPAVHKAGLDEDLFALGLDSLGVFAAIKSIRASLGLQQELGPRHLYANPTLAKFSGVLEKLAAKGSTKSASRGSGDNGSNPIARMIAINGSRQSFRLNALDYVNPNHYMGLNFYLPLREGVSFEQVFSLLQQGLNRTLELIPAISGKMMQCSEQEVGYKKGELCVTIPPLSMSANFANRLIYNDLSQTLPSFGELQKTGFLPSTVKDELVLPDDTFPKMPADILVAQANFVEGGCIIAVNLNHCCLDAVGVMVFSKAWAENCRYLQGDSSATCDLYDPESFNHSLPEILHELEGYSRPVEEVDLGTWGFLPFTPPDHVLEQHENSIAKSGGLQEGALPPPPKYPLHSVWPLPSAERVLDSTMFLITPENLEKLKSDVSADSGTKDITSTSDIVQAFFWRAAIRARYRVAKELRGETFGSEEMSILELPTDGRPYFSSQLPPTYMGSMLVLNRSSMSIETLCSPQTSIARIAQLLRSAASRITPSLVHDAFTLLQSLPDYDRFSTANMGLSHMHAMISNMMLFQPNEISFGDTFFSNGGSPESMRPQLERGNGRFRFLVIFPMRKDGGLELVMGTFPEEREMLETDDEFTRYAKLVDVCSDGNSQP